MNRINKFTVLLICIVCVSVASAIPAQVWWSRGDPNTTWQEWTFDGSDNPAAPESFFNPYGEPEAKLSTPEVPPDYFGWLTQMDGRQGVWTGEPLDIKLDIPNRPNLEDYKEVWLEAVFQRDLTHITVTPSPTMDSYVNEVYRDISVIQSDPQWYLLTVGWYIEPNPLKERICIRITGTGGRLDRVGVDTYCIPEPATVGLLGLGAGMLAVLRRRRAI